MSHHSYFWLIFKNKNPLTFALSTRGMTPRHFFDEILYAPSLSHFTYRWVNEWLNKVWSRITVILSYSRLVGSVRGEEHHTRLITSFHAIWYYCWLVIEWKFMSTFLQMNDSARWMVDGGWWMVQRKFFCTKEKSVAFTTVSFSWEVTRFHAPRVLETESWKLSSSLLTLWSISNLSINLPINLSTEKHLSHACFG